MVPEDERTFQPSIPAQDITAHCSYNMSYDACANECTTTPNPQHSLVPPTVKHVPKRYPNLRGLKNCSRTLLSGHREKKRG